MERLDAADKKCEKVRPVPFQWVSILGQMVNTFLMSSKVAEDVSKNLASLKEVLSGSGDKEPQTEAVAQLAQELYNTDLLICLITNLQRIDFEVGYLRRRSIK